NKKQQTKTTKHTIEFSNNTPGTSARPREQARGRKPRSRRTDSWNIPKSGDIPEGAAALCGRTASQRLP
ncbi:MAG TPA: hypothetical protein PLH92_14980, partial [Mycobacterium sp.]|uniref:hypothetical protein n=1 Tax=Mycolicibacterium sp. TaxID=2320850 RepID=UPI0025FCB94D